MGFKTIDGHMNADSISKVLIEQLHVVCSDSEFDKGRLIAHTFDGASVMRGASGGVRKKVQDVNHVSTLSSC